MTDDDFIPFVYSLSHFSIPFLRSFIIIKSFVKYRSIGRSADGWASGFNFDEMME